MELRHLRYFVAVAEEEHLGRAARRLHVSPPPLSKQIQQLEEELGVPLFARVGRGLKLTEGGRLFLGRARAILADVGRSVAAVQATARGEAGHLVVGFTETGTFAEMVPAVAASMRQRHPNVSLELQPMGWREMVPALLAGRLDAALGNEVPAEPALRSALLLTERIVLALPSQHPLARQERVTSRELRDVPFVWLPRAALPDTFRQTVAELAARGVTFNVVVEARSTVTRLAMVAAGMGVTFALESTRAMLPPGVVLRPVCDVQLTVSSVLAWRGDADGWPVLRSWRDLALEFARRRHAADGAAGA